MSNRDRKAAKKKKREKLKKKRLLARRLALPSIGFEKCSASEFDAAVREEFFKFVRTPKDYLSPFYIRILRTLKTDSVDRKFYESFSEDEWVRHINDATERIATSIFDALPNDLKKKYCPKHSFDVTITKKLKLLVSYSEIETQPTKMGTLYFSSKRPKVTVNRLPAKIAFTSHAYDRIVERCLPFQQTYNGVAMIHSLFGGKLYFRPTSDNEFLQVFFMARPEEMAMTQKTGIIYVSVGYCPLEFHHRENPNQSASWVAKTLLILGMKNTPERRLIEQLPLNLRDVVVQRLEEIVAYRDVFIFLWFQFNGYDCLYEKVGDDLVPLSLDFCQFYDRGLSDEMTPEENFKFFLGAGLQNFLGETTIPLP